MGLFFLIKSNEVGQCCELKPHLLFLFQAVLRKVKELGLRALLLNDLILRSIVRSILALPLLPAALIDRGLQTLIVEATRGGYFLVLQPLFNYWIDTWGRQRFFQFLSVFGVAHRTNNVCESANRLLRSKTGAHRPGLWHFLCK